MDLHLGNLTPQCGSSDLRPWNSDENDFGQCFLLLFVHFPVLSLLAITSAFYSGKRRLAPFLPPPLLYTSWTSAQSALLLTRSAATALLVLSSSTQLLLILTSSYSAPGSSSPSSFTSTALAALTPFAFFLHLIYTLRVKHSWSFDTRGPRPVLFAWTLSALLTIVHFRRAYFIHPAPIPTTFASLHLALQVIYFLTLLPGSALLHQRHYRHRSRVSHEALHSAYEGQESNSYTGFDEGGADDDEELPLGTAKEGIGILSFLTFSWVTPLMKKGACGFLNSAENLWDLPHYLETQNVGGIFHGRLRTYRSLLRSLYAQFSCEFFSVGVLKFISDAMGFAGPVLLNLVVEFVEGGGGGGGDGTGTNEYWKGYAYVGGLFLSALVKALANTHFNMQMAEVNIKVRAALVTTIYRKTIRMRKTTLEMFSTGEVINFMSTDTDRIVNFCPSFHAFWSLPAQVALTLFLLYQQIGLAFLAGLVFAIVLIPINRCIANKIGELSTTMMKYKDQRVKLMSEVLYGIRTLKFHSWEKFFYQKVAEIREKEMKSLKGRKYLDALCVYFWATTPVLVSLLSFGTYVLLGNELKASKVFTSLALFNMLIAPLNALPWVLNGVVEAWVSIRRINKFLLAEETEAKDIYAQLPTAMRTETALTVEGCTFQWNGEADDAPLSLDLQNLSISKGKFIGIIGNVGSGKTSVLLALLGELNKLHGTLSVPDPDQGVGLVLQDSWIQRGTIRSNICFAPNTNLTRYTNVIDACALKEDLNAFKWRDDTLVGDNGLGLSGGQKVRLSLARAVYQDFDTYFLDDIFAAVDFKVAIHLYRQCVMGILKSKTRVLCTHHTRFLKEADWILVMDGGRVIAEGLPDDILPTYGAKEEEFDEIVSSPSIISRRSLEESVEEEQITQMSKSSHSFELPSSSHLGPIDEDETSCSLNEENQAVGSIDLHVFSSYYHSVGPCLFWAIIISIAAMQASKNASDLWLAYWVSQEISPPNATTGPPIPTFETILEVSSVPSINSDTFTDYVSEIDPDVKYYLTIFMSIGILNSVLGLARAFLFALGGILGAIRIHSALLNSILEAKMSFFDVTPIGRILNRFSSDVSTIDDSLPFISNILLARLFGLMGTLALTCYALPWVLVLVIPLLVVCANIQEYYRHTARQLRRVGSVSLSPVYAHFSETLQGLVFIRAMRAGSKFEEMNEHHLECSQKAAFATQAVGQWLGIRLQMVGVLIVSAVGLLGVLQHHYGEFADPGIVGLAISYALIVTESLNGFVTVLTETEKEMVSVERAVEYIEDVEEELETTDDAPELPPPAVFYLWPAQGVLSFTNVSLKYRENLPYVLKNVTFETRPAEKIGVCGRTGSGKSSLFAVLFRMVDKFDGEVKVDHVNVKSLKLKELRSKMCIIPQDPLIFTGTLRENLDPLGERNDDAIYRAIDKCQLREMLRKLGGLDAFVGDCGSLLSAGQKQLLCLARAVLINAKILCIDEATANVDLETDKIIQSTLRTSFSQSTVITVAHRVNTILHCDRVLVMSGGELVEFDDPARLMEQSSSHFYQLAHGNV